MPRATRYSVCVMVDGQPGFRTVAAATIGEACRQRELLQTVARVGELRVSPRLTFAEVSVRWLAEFEAKVTAGERRGRSLRLFPPPPGRPPPPPPRPPPPGPVTPPRVARRLRALHGDTASSLAVQWLPRA